MENQSNMADGGSIAKNKKSWQKYFHFDRKELRIWTCYHHTVITWSLFGNDAQCCDQEIIPLLRCPCLRDGPWPPPQPDRGSEVARLMNLGPSNVKYSAAKLPVIRAPVLSWSQPPPVLRGAFYWGSVFNTYHKVVN